MTPDQETTQEFNRAIARDDIGRVETLAHKVPALVVQSTVLGSCLHLAAEYGRLRIVKVLVELGADIDLEAEVGGTPLQLAATEGHFDVVRFLIEKGASLAAPRPDRNPLFSSICGGHAKVARLLLDLK